MPTGCIRGVSHLKEKWFQVLLDKLKESWSGRIIVVDHDNLGKAEEIAEALSEQFHIHHYQDEVTLRLFLKKITEERVIIFKGPKEGYIPYDIEQSSDLITWQLKDVFPKLHIPTIKSIGPRGFQEIFEGYKTMEKSPASAAELETQRLIESWVQHGSQKKGLSFLKEAVVRIKALLETENIDWKGDGWPICGTPWRVLTGKA
jgi:hypothetical protein